MKSELKQILRLLPVVMLVSMCMSLLVMGCKNGDDDGDEDKNPNKGTEQFLSSLKLSFGSLKPVFSKDNLNYTAKVSIGRTSMAVIPTLDNTNDTLEVDGVSLVSGTASLPKNLAIGENTAVAIKVTASDGGTSKTYSVVPTRGISAQEAYIKSSDSAQSDDFGSALDISGDTLVVGAQAESSYRGAVYVYVKDGSGDWGEQAKVTAFNADNYDYFGWSVAIDGNTLAVGAYGEDSCASGINGDSTDDSCNTGYGPGAVYILDRDSSGNWNQSDYIKASNPEPSDYFGNSVDLSNNTLVVGAPYESSSALGVNGNQNDNGANDSGAVYVFIRDATGDWTQQGYIKASNTETSDYFGKSVSVSGNTLVVGAYREDSNATGVNGVESDNSLASSGAAYVFIRDATGDWSQKAYLKPSDTASNDQFGISVAIDGSTIVIGADGGGGSGSAYVFVRDTTGDWSQQAVLKASNTGPGDGFGRTVDLFLDSIIIGAYSEDSVGVGINPDATADNTASAAGAAYVFSRESGVWTEQFYLKASNSDIDDEFSTNREKGVAISEDTIAVGANKEDSNATGINADQTDNSHATWGSGAVYVY